MLKEKFDRKMTINIERTERQISNMKKAFEKKIE